MREEALKRASVSLEDDFHDGLQRLATVQGRSLAGLIRDALETAYSEDIDDARVAREELAAHRADPESAISLHEIRLRLRTRGTASLQS